MRSICAVLLAATTRLSTGAFKMLPNGCSWYETNRLGGCLRRSEPRKECKPAEKASDAPKRPAHNLAVVVPHRSTTSHVNPRQLDALCNRLINSLMPRRLRFQLFVVNQVDKRPFNRGALANAAVSILLHGRGSSMPFEYKHMRHAYFDYVAIHDIDRYPVLGNQSGCDGTTADYYSFPAKSPRVLHPSSFAGGVLVLPTDLYSAVNGFSNSYWGWGEEDNDLFLRLRWCGLPPVHGARLEECMEHQD
jgi:xylosylprotein 4-beta-galactosyltransferase